MTSKRPNKRRCARFSPLAALAVGLLLIGLVAWLCWPVAVTQLTLNATQPIVCRFSAQTWRLTWLHSVEKTPWSETYQRQGQQLRLISTEFKSFGAGTPSSGTLLPAPPGYVAYAVNVDLPELNWVVSRRVRSSLWLGEQAWPLFEWVPDYTEAHFVSTSAPRWRTLTKDFCHEQ